jgi:hypothetical protein
MGVKAPRTSPFRFEIERGAGNVVLASWQGHMNQTGLAEHCDVLDDALAGIGSFVLVIDATGVSGYDPAVHRVARQWAMSEPASRARAVAIIADSQLAAAESPAASMAPPRKARLFGSRRAAMAFVESVAMASSGEYTVVDAPIASNRVAG